jgi:hypothetical protein
MKVCFKIEFKRWEILLKECAAYLHLAIRRRTLMGFNRRDWQERLIVLVHVNQPHDGP